MREFPVEEEGMLASLANRKSSLAIQKRLHESGPRSAYRTQSAANSWENARRTPRLGRYDAVRLYRQMVRARIRLVQ